MLSFLDAFYRDLRFGLRNLARSRGFAALAAGSLALGIGATTAMYSVIYAVIINPFPYKDVDQLMSVKVEEPGSRSARVYYTVDQYLEIRQRNSIFSGVIASSIYDVLWTDRGEPLRLRGNPVSMNTFEVMGVAPLLGRVTTPADALADAEPVVILGYRFWQRQFGGDPGVLGLKMRLNGTVRTVIGVMPRPFMWRGADVYMPMTYRRGETPEGIRYVHVLGRLKPGVNEARAESDLRPIIEELQKQNPRDFPEKWRVSLLPFTETFPSGIRQTLWILFGAVGLLLVIACVNVSNLLLSKATSRRTEIAVRASLGATRWRIVRQLLSEGLILSIAGGSLGVGVAYAGLKGIVAAVPPDTIPDEAVISINAPVLAFTLGLSIAAALVFGLAPALHVSGRDVTSPLKESGRGAMSSLSQRILRSTLVIAEVALSLMLLVGASLMIRTLFAIQNVDTGARADRVLTMRIPLSDQRYPDPARRVAFLRELLGRVEALPGVVAAGLNTSVHPLGNMTAPVDVAGAVQDNRPVMVHQTSQDYPRAVGIPLVEGRMMDEHEVANGAHVALVNEAFVRRFLPARDALGRVVHIPRLRVSPFRLTDDGFEIVGVVKDALNRISTDETLPEVYIPYTVTGTANVLVVLTAVGPLSMEKAVRRQVYSIDKDQPVTDVRTLQRLLDDYVYSQPRFNFLLFSIFAGLGLTLALLGVYGVISNFVAQRTHEIGVRMALGADFSQVMAMVLASGVKLIGAGIALGLIGSLFAVRLLSHEVWRLSTFDPVSFTAVSALVFAAGLMASFWPARRATRIDPVAALRHE